MVKVSKQVDYAIQFLMQLAVDSDNTTSLRQFSSDRDISFLFMQKIAKKLREAKLVKSYRGARGGYVLERTPETLSIKEIMESIEGPYKISNCISTQGEVCKKIDSCSAKKPLYTIQNQISDYLQNTSLKSLINIS